MSTESGNEPIEVLHVRKMGDSIGVLLPKSLAARRDLKAGDQLYIVEAADGVLTLSPFDPLHAEAIKIARRSFKDYANTYKALAK